MSSIFQNTTRNIFPENLYLFYTFINAMCSEALQNFFLVLPWTDAVCHSQIFADLATLSLFFFGQCGIYCCQHHMWHILCCFFRKAKHSIEGLISKLAAHQFMITVCIRCIQADGDGLYQTFQFRCHIFFSRSDWPVHWY